MPKLEEDKVVDRGDTFDPEVISELEDDDDGEEFESSIEDDEDEELEEEEETDEEEEESDEEEEDSEDEEEEEIVDDARIPKGRFNQVIKQRDRERERAAKLAEQNEALIRKLTEIEEYEYEEEEEEPPVEKYDFKGRKRESMDLWLEGEFDKALEIEEEIAAKREAVLRAELKALKEESRNIARQVQEDEKFGTLVESYESKFPFLDINNEEFNEEAVDTVNALLGSFVNRGDNKLVALRKAVERVTQMYKKESEPTKPVVKKKVTTTPAVKRNISASKAQPPRQTGKKVESRDIGTLRASQLSDRDFAKLTEREKRILRGD